MNVENTLPINTWWDSGSLFAIFSPAPSDRYIEFRMTLDCTFEQGREYQYSKLYFAHQRGQAFDELRVICFQPVHRERAELVRIVLPEASIASGFMRIRIDGLPYSDGAFEVIDIRLCTGVSGGRMSELADLAHHRQWVREEVLHSEAHGRSHLPHYPESISIELTARCNLRCPHCSSHGTPELHAIHNQRADISPSLLERIAHELFPHVTAVSLVGRGEPTLVSDEIWERCMGLVKHYGVKISCVTNGHHIKKRFGEDVLPFVDELCVSVDGNTPETHYINRGGSSLEKVLDNVAYFHRARQAMRLARRPKLSIYWTLMSNNIHELPDFIRRTAEFDPDYFAIRHLVVFHDKDRARSLLGRPEIANRFLEEAYQELHRLDIKYEAPPLMDERVEVDALPEVAAARGREASLGSMPCDASPGERDLSEQCTWMHRTGIIMSDGEVTTCGKHYGEQMGILDENVSFNDIWNGPGMRSLRTSFGTPDMWSQCRDCWLRELRWHSQRRARNEGFRYDNEDPATYTHAAWDYRSYDSL